MRKVGIFAILIALGSGAARAQTAAPADAIYRTFAYKCDFTTMNHVEVSNCLGDALKRIRIRLAAAYRKALADADGSESNGDMGGKTAAQIALQHRTDLTKSQVAWKSYLASECSRSFDLFDLAGGNGGDIVDATCELHHTAARIVELEQPPL